MSSITAISVSYNSAQVIEKSLAALSACPQIACIMVVDNNSTDDSIERVQQQFPHVTLIENPRNEGFGRGNNIALKKVGTPYALLVNPDAVVTTEAVDHLLAAAENYKDAAILAPRLMDENGKVHVSFKPSVFNREKRHCERMRSNPVMLLASLLKWIATSPAAPRNDDVSGDLCADYLSGAVWLLNMAHMKKVGWFDANIFLYYEDDDLCLRVRQAGFSCVLVAAAQATHLMGASSGAPSVKSEFFKQQQLIWSRLYLEQKYHGEKVARRLAQKLQIEYAVKAALYTLQCSRLKIARYRGRIAGVVAFRMQPTTAPTR